MGAFPTFVLEDRVPDIVERLISGTEITKDTEKWAEGRRDCIFALTNIVKNVGIKKEQGTKIQFFAIV